MEEITARNTTEWERWLESNHDRVNEIWIRVGKKASGIESVQPEEATEVALCFGWIDSHRRGGDDKTYLQRYSPRRRGSNWSDRNIAVAERLIAEGRMRPIGLNTYRLHVPQD